MAHIVIVTSGITSLYNAAFALADRLRGAGHSVTYASAARIRAVVEAHGLPFVQLQAEEPHSQPQGMRGGMVDRAAQWLRKLANLRARQAQALARLGGDDFAAQMALIKPDLCIIDIELSAYLISACALKIPTAALAAFISLRKYRAVPPLHLAIVPGQGWRGSRLGIEWAWLRFRAWKWLHFHMQRLRAVGADPISVLRLHARRAGFPFEDAIDRYQWLLPFIFRQVPLLYTNAREIDFPHTPHPTVRHLGPQILLNRIERQASADDEVMDALLSRLQAKRAQSPTYRLIYCAFGAFFKGDDSAFFRRVVAALSTQTDWEVILALGGRGDPQGLGPLPGHIHAFAWVPQVRILAQADCAVIHGGIGTMNECIHFGVPMLVYPFKHTNDQMGAAARIAYHQLGIVGDRDRDDEAHMRQHIHTLLTDPDYRARVAQMRAHFARYADENRAVHIVNALLSREETAR